MTCQRCSREASVHLSETVDGHRRELHLCGPCARKAGLTPPDPPPNAALEAIVDHLIVQHVGELVGELARTSCPLCGLKFMDFRTGGRLGCPNDYEAFTPGLLPLLRAAHGASRHVGKIPRKRTPPSHSPRLRLRARLREAIAREDYELAATIRDQLRQEDADQ
jgi:protein arginine kinase activator